jgi:hypothetical protein
MALWSANRKLSWRPSNTESALTSDSCCNIAIALIDLGKGELRVLLAERGIKMRKNSCDPMTSGLT